MRYRGWQGLAAAGIAVLVASCASADLILKNKPAPKWTGKTVQGKAVNSAQYKSKVLLMNFFSYN